MDSKDSKKQNHKVTIFAILLSLISIGVLVFGFTILSSDKVIMLQSISNIYNKVNTNFDKDTSILDMIANNNDVGVKITTSIKEEDNNYIINANYLENNKDKNSLLNLDVELNEEKAFNGSLLLNNSKFYFNMLDITEDYYYDKLDYVRLIRSLSSDDCEKLLSILKNAINSSISNDDIKKEKAVITYNGKDKKVNKLTYDINKKEMKEILTEFISSLKNDKKLFKNVAKVLNIKEKELNKKLAGYVLKVANMDEKNIFSYSTYYYGFNKIVQYDLNIYEKNIFISYKEEKNKTTLLVNKDDKNMLTLVENTDNTFKGNLDLTDFETDKFDITEYKKNYEFVGSKTDDSLKMTINDNADVSIKRSNDAKSYKYNVDIKKYEVVEDKKVEKSRIKSNIEFYFNEKIELDDIELDTAKKYSELTEEEKKVFLEKLENNKIYGLYGKQILDKYFEEENY